MRKTDEKQHSSVANEIARKEKRATHSQDQQPISNMKLMLTILLAVVCQAYTPINERSWVKFRKVKDPTYNTVPQHREPDIIQATHNL